MSVSLHVRMCNTCKPDSLRGQKRALESLELELLMIESRHVVAGNRTHVPCKTN